jgi:RNA polymerase sigma factor (sigma-70 family)
VEASALGTRPTHPAAGLSGRSPLLRLQSDERLIALVRRGNHGAFEVLVGRYQSRLLAFCRHMLGSREDAEDVLQEVFAAAFNAILADERAINARPWLYRIARNRSLNHLRRVQPIGVDSMDVHLSEHGATTADKVDGREALRELVADVQELPETQRTALLLREIDALSYEQIAEAMETTIPSVKSLLVRARVSLAEAAEARRLSCDEVRYELGEIAEGLRHRTSPPVRRHLRACERCATFRTELRASSKALAMLLPVGPLLLAKKLLLAHLGLSAGASGGAAGGTAAGAATGGGLLSAGMGTIATKAAVGLAAAAAVTAGAVEIERHAPQRAPSQAEPQAQAVVAQAPAVAPRASAPFAPPRERKASAQAKRAERKPGAEAEEPTPTTTETAATAPVAVGEAGHTQVESSATSLPVALPAPAPQPPPPPPTTTSADTPASAPAAATTPPPDPATTTPDTTAPPPDATSPPAEPPPAEPAPEEAPVGTPPVEVPAGPPGPATPRPPGR